MTFSRKILTGLAAGVATGLFFGEEAAALEWAADGFVKLLQMTVLPYVTVSIVSSLGRLDYGQARALGWRVGAVVAGPWIIALAFAFAIPIAFPNESASFFSSTLVEKRPPFDFVSLYIPANPFHSLANNVVPAVVLFSVLLGVALIGVERKAVLLDVLQVVGQAVAKATRMVTYFADALIPVAEYPRLAFTGVVTFFGSLNTAVPFLLDLFRIPADTFQLFLATGVINSRFGTLLAAVHTVTVALLVTCAVAGVLTWRPRRVLRYVVSTVVAALAVLGGARALFETVLDPTYRKDQVLAQPVQSVSLAAADAEPGAPGAATLETIRARGALRVGHLTDSLPFAFVNARGELVGFDIDLAHRLAAELGVRLELVDIPRGELHAFLEERRCDLVMSGVLVTTSRAAQLLFSHSYLDETLALLVRDYDRERFSSWDAVRAHEGLTIGVPDVPYYVDKIRERAPRAAIRTLRTVEDIFGRAMQVDAVALPAERGSAWTLLYPQYAVVVPEGPLVKMPLAYPIGGHDEAFAAFVNTWLELKRKDGTLDMLFKYWVLGQDAVPAAPRWSILRNVLKVGR